MAFESVTPYPLHVGEIATFVLSISLTTLAVSARIYTKVYITKFLGWEDYFCLVGWIGMLALVGLAIAVVQCQGDTLYGSYLTSVIVTLYGPVLVLVKISVLLQYIRIFAPHRQGWFYTCALCLIGINVLYYTTTMFLVIFQCTPRQSMWDPAMPGHCVDRHMFQLPSAIIDIVSDFTILLLPLPLIWRLQLTTRKKLGVYAIFGLGVFACVTSIAALENAINLLRMASNDMDAPFAMDAMGLWTIAEIAIGILVGCLPILPKFFQQFSATKNSAHYKPNRYVDIGRPNNRSRRTKAPDCNEDRQSTRPHIGSYNLDAYAIPSRPLATHWSMRNNGQPFPQQKQVITPEESYGHGDDRDLER